MANSTTDTPGDQADIELEPSRTLNLSECDVCHRNMIDGFCKHCGRGHDDVTQVREITVDGATTYDC